MKTFLIVLFVSLLCLSAEPLRAAQTKIAMDSIATNSAPSIPVPVPEMSEKAAAYYSSGNILWFVDFFWGLLIPVLILFTGFSSRMRTWATKFGKKWFFVIGIYFVFFSVFMFIADLPLSYYEEFVRQHAYDLSNQTFGKWLGDSVKSLFVGVVIGFLFLWIPYLLLKKSPNRWWLYVGVLTVPFLFLSLLIGPIWIEPLFNDFGPMKDKALETKILALADRAGIEGSRVFEVNKSVDTKQLNAYVTGFLGCHVPKPEFIVGGIGVIDAGIVGQANSFTGNAGNSVIFGNLWV